MGLPSSEKGIVRRPLYRSAPARLEGRFRLVGAIRVYERSAANGEAPVVVLVHGVGRLGPLLCRPAGYLAPQCAVFAPDLPGFGRSASLAGRRWCDGCPVRWRPGWMPPGLDRPDVLFTLAPAPIASSPVYETTANPISPGRAGSRAVAHVRCSSPWFGGAFRGYDVPRKPA